MRQTPNGMVASTALAKWIVRRRTLLVGTRTAETMLAATAVGLALGTAPTLSAAATNPGQPVVAKQVPPTQASVTPKLPKTKTANTRAALGYSTGLSQIYLAPFPQYPITTKLYIYSPGVSSPEVGSTDDPNSCETSGSNCTDEQLCQFWGINCSLGGIPVLFPNTTIARAPDQGSSSP